MYYNNGMKFTYFVFLYLFIFGNFSFVSSQTTPPPSCQIMPDTNPCYLYLNYTDIYVPMGLQISDVLTYIEANLTALTLIPDSTCRPNAIKLFCLKSFPKCNNIIPMIPLLIPSSPCRSSCESVVSTCSVYLPLIDPNFSCTNTATDGSGNPEYPPVASHYDLSMYGGSADETIQCSAGTQEEIKTPTTCIPPLIYLSKEEVEGKDLYYETVEDCYLPCGIQIMTDSEAKAKRVTEILLYTISGVAGLYFILTFGVFPNNLTHKMIIQCYLGITSIVLVLSYVVQESRENFRCFDDQPGRYANSQNAPLCVLSGIFFQIGGFGTIMFLFMFSLDFFLTMNMKKFTYFKHASIAIWTFTILMSLVPIRHYTSSIGSAGCWIDDKSNMFYQYFCFYVPIYAITFVMIILVSNSVYKVYGMMKLFKSLNDKRILILNIRSLVFLLIILFDITFASMYPLYVTYNGDDYTKPIENYVMCLYTSEKPKECPPPLLPHFDLRYINVFTMAINGFIGIIGFGIDPVVLQIYRESYKFKYILAKFGIKYADNLILYSSARSHTTSESSGSGSGSGSDSKSNSRKSRAISMKTLKDSSIKQEHDNIQNTEHVTKGDEETGTIITDTNPTVIILQDNNNNNNNNNNDNNNNNNNVTGIHLESNNNNNNSDVQSNNNNNSIIQSNSNIKFIQE